MRLARKILLGLTLGSVFFGVGILIAAIFGLDVFTGTWLKVLQSLATIAVAGLFSFNALNFMRKSKIIALITFALIGTLTVMMFIIYWGNIEFTSTFSKIITILAVTTIFFNIIVSNILKLNRNHLTLQIITYALIGAIDIILILQICEIDVISRIPRIFVVACLVVFALLITLFVFGKKAPEEEVKIDGEKVVKLKQSEYDALLGKIKELEEKLKEKSDQE